MASTTSVISLLVLLLATYCYSAPPAQRYGSSTPIYESTTVIGKSKFDYGSEKKMTYVDEESTTVSDMHKPQPSGEHHMSETTTVGDLKHGEDVTRSSRKSEDRLHSSSPMTSTFEPSSPMTSTFQYSSTDKHGQDVTRGARKSEDLVQSSSPMTSTFEPSSPMTSTVEYSSTDKHDEDVTRAARKSEEVFQSSSPMTSTDKYELHGFLPTTMESSTQFHQRAIHSNDMESDAESTTGSFKESTTTDANDESTTEPSSSGDSFGKMTGLLNGKRPEERSSSTPVNDKYEHSSEESTTRSSGKDEHYTKVISVYPGTFTKTEFFRGPNDKYEVRQGGQNQPKPISQESSKTDIEKRGWDM